MLLTAINFNPTLLTLPFQHLGRLYANDWPCTAIVQVDGRNREVFMLAVHLMSVLSLAASSLAWAQLVIENPGHLDMPEQQAQVLFLTTNRVLESEFHSPGALENAFRMKFVLGEKAERFTIDDSSGNGTIYLEKSAGKPSASPLTIPQETEHLSGKVERRKICGCCRAACCATPFGSRAAETHARRDCPTHPRNCSHKSGAIPKRADIARCAASARRLHLANDERCVTGS